MVAKRGVKVKLRTKHNLAKKALSGNNLINFGHYMAGTKNRIVSGTSTIQCCTCTITCKGKWHIRKVGTRFFLYL